MKATNQSHINLFQIIFKTVMYNLKIVFGGKFFWFLFAAMAFFLVFTGIMLFAGSVQDNSDIFYFLMFPGLLVIFYPVVYNIQNDKDARMLEIIFSIPDYRYKIFMVRFVIAFLLLIAVLFLLAGFTWFAILQIPIAKMVYHLMFPMFFLGCLAFLFSTITHSGNATAVIIILLGIFFFIFNEPLKGTAYNVFLNPFNMPPGNTTEASWVAIVNKNRMILLIGSVISILWAFINLQRRDKFMR